MAAMKETVLYYCPQGTKHKNKVKAALIQMGVRIKNVPEEQLTESVGYLAGIPGFEKSQDAPFGASLPEEVLVMKDFTSSRMDTLFARLRKARVPKIALKAVLTPSNAQWTFLELYEELKKEHQVMSARKVTITSIVEPDFGCEGRMEGQSVLDEVTVRTADKGEEMTLSVEDAYLLKEGMNEGDEVLLTPEGRLIPLETVHSQGE